jgi:hypothetical protein
LAGQNEQPTPLFSYAPAAAKGGGRGIGKVLFAGPLLWPFRRIHPPHEAAEVSSLAHKQARYDNEPRGCHERPYPISRILEPTQTPGRTASDLGVRQLAAALAGPRTVASEEGWLGCPACSARPKRWQATALQDASLFIDARSVSGSSVSQGDSRGTPVHSRKSHWWRARRKTEGLAIAPARPHNTGDVR